MLLPPCFNRLHLLASSLTDGPQFDRACMYQDHARDSITVLLLDEVGLAEHRCARGTVLNVGCAVWARGGLSWLWLLTSAN